MARSSPRRTCYNTRWALAGALAASATLVNRTPVDAAELQHSLQRLRIVVPAETRLAGRLVDAGTQNPQEPARRFDIAGGPLQAALAEFERITGLRVLISSGSIGEITSPGVLGVYTSSQALARLLEGTSITYRFSGPNTVTLEIRLAPEAVNVIGETRIPAPSQPKYTKPLIEVPQTIEVIPREVMEAQGVTTLSDALRNVPGISLQAGEGGGASSTTGDMFNMRGFSANNSLFVDGVRDDGLMSRDVFNLEQVEVFMGPTGSDVGRGNAAGYVNMSTKTPHEGSSYAVSYGYGSADQNRSTVDLNHALPIGQPGSWLSHSAVRLNALWQDGGVPGRDIVENKNQSIAPSVAFGLSTPTRVSLAAQITRQDNVPDYGVPGSAWLDTPLAPTTVRALQPVASSNFYGSVGYDYDKVEQDSYTGRIEHDLNVNLTLRNQTRYNETHRTAVISTAQSPTSFVPETQQLTIARQGNERENTILSNQTSLVGRFMTGRIRHAASAGLELATEEQFAPTLAGVGNPRTTVSIYNPNPYDPITGYAVGRSAALNRGETSSVGLYAFYTVELGSKWQLSGGLRWERYNADFTIVDTAGLTTTDLEASDGLLSGKAGVLYQLTNIANVYFSFGSTVTPPGTANFTLSAQPNNQNNPNVKPQESKNYEVGTKVGFYDNRLSLSAAVFRTDNKNVIFTVDAVAIPPVYNQDDGQRVDGFSIGSLGQINEHWQVIANFGYLNTRQISQNPVNNGKDLTLTPPFSGSLWTTYELPIGLTIGGGVRRMDRVFVNAANTIRVPGYSLVDLMAEYAVNTHLSLRLNVTNLTDETYIRNINNNGGRYNPGLPRAATFTSSVRF